MAGVKQMFLLIIFQGFYLGSVCQRWTFPSTMTALIGSCVEIPCIYHPGRISDTSGTVWYLYRTVGYPEILNTKDSSSVIEDYKDRTSLVPGENSCTLRIDPVRREDEGKYYYPGIAEDRKINAYDEHSTYLQLDVTESPGNIDLSGSWTIREGEATTIRCSVDHTCGSRPPSLQWNKPGQVIKRSMEISGGSWREESELTYIPSYEDDGSSVQCTAKYPNGQRKEKSERLNIIFPPQHVTVTILGNDRLMEGSDVNLLCTSISRPEAIGYEWYKGRNKTKLLYKGWKMTVYNVTRDMEPYSCTAINRVGRGESAPIEIPVLYDRGSSHSCIESNSNIILLVTIGTVCPLLVVVLVYVCWRNRSRNVTRSEAPEFPNATYTDLVINNIASDYEELKPVNPPKITGGHGGATFQNM